MGLCLNLYFRFILLCLFIRATFQLGYVYATRGLVLAGWLGDLTSTSVPWHVHTGASSIVAALIVALVSYYYSQKFNLLLRESSTYVDREKVEGFLQRCIEELRKPHPKVLGRRLLDRITELPLEERTLISALKQLADSGEFFLKSDQILEAIDRVDLRRRQKALQPERFGATNQN